MATLHLTHVDRAQAEEERAEVDVLLSVADRTAQLNKKLVASLANITEIGNNVQEASGPFFRSTQTMQLRLHNLDGMMESIEKMVKPSNLQSDEDHTIRSGIDQSGVREYLAAAKRVLKSLNDLKSTNLQANQRHISNLSGLVKTSIKEIERCFKNTLQEDSKPVEPLHYVTKNKQFPVLSQDQIDRLRPLAAFLVRSSGISDSSSKDGIAQGAYAKIRSSYISSTLRSSSLATVGSLKIKDSKPDELYKRGNNGIGYYVKAVEGIFLSEYENITSIFPQDEVKRVFHLTCQPAVTEFANTVRELNNHVKANMATECFLSYEVEDLVQGLIAVFKERTGDLKQDLTTAMKPIRDTAKQSFSDLIDALRRSLQEIQVFPGDGAALPMTHTAMKRLVNMVQFLPAIARLLVSLGDNNWKISASAIASADSIPSLKSFDIRADGEVIFAHYCADYIDALMTALEMRARALLTGAKSKIVLGVFLFDNYWVAYKAITDEPTLARLITPRLPVLEGWQKKATSIYCDPWKDLSATLIDQVHTNRSGGGRPNSGGGTMDSTAIVKALSSKERDSIKEKFKVFFANFDELVQKHRSMKMQHEVRDELGKQAMKFVDPMYTRFWDRYHGIDKGKNKHIKYSKSDVTKILTELAYNK